MKYFSKKDVVNIVENILAEMHGALYFTLNQEYSNKLEEFMDDCGVYIDYGCNEK